MLEGFSEILRESTSNYYDLQSIIIESTVMMNYKNGSMNWFWLFDGLIKQAYPISVASFSYGSSQQYFPGFLDQDVLYMKKNFQKFKFILI